MNGNEIVAKALTAHGVELVFFIMGGPLLGLEAACAAEGIRMIDVRHEQAAAMMANGYARIGRRPAVCMACSGPGATNLVTGVAAAMHDGAPVIAIAGSAPINQRGKGLFQEMDQVAMFAPITQWSQACLDVRRLAGFVDAAFREAFSGRPGPVYLDLPGDIVNGTVDDEQVEWPTVDSSRRRPFAAPDLVDQAVELLAAATRPAIITGSGVIWSCAEPQLRSFVDSSGIPFWTTPHGKGVIPEDHELCLPGARGAAFRGTDLIIQVATRQNYIIDHLEPPRWNADAKLIQIDLDPVEIGRNRAPDVALVGDAGSVLRQLVDAGQGRLTPERYSDWVSELRSLNDDRAARQEAEMTSDAEPIHPLRLCKEVRDILPRDAIVCVDGQEILTYARQTIPFYAPHSLNSGPFGCMGVGLPYGIGAKLAKPDTPVLILHGDGSFGMNAMEIDTALRHQIPIVCVISNNGGWTGSPTSVPGRDLGFTRYDLMFESIGAHTELVQRPEQIRPALQRALQANKPAIVNVITDPTIRASLRPFTRYMT
jgi:thiamine pyrophosphate-dependent acetolactate synthase large subunit-like protein